MPCILWSSWLLKLVLWIVNALFSIAWMRTKQSPLSTFFGCLPCMSSYYFQRHSFTNLNILQSVPIYIYNSFSMVKRAIQSTKLPPLRGLEESDVCNLTHRRLFPQFDPLTSRLHGKNLLLYQGSPSVLSMSKSNFISKHFN